MTDKLDDGGSATGKTMKFSAVQVANDWTPSAGETFIVCATNEDAKKAEHLFNELQSTIGAIESATIERCAKVCEEVSAGHTGAMSSMAEETWGASTAKECAKEIRALLSERAKKVG